MLNLPSDLFIDLGLMTAGTAYEPMFLADSVFTVLGDDADVIDNATNPMIYFRELGLYKYIANKNTWNHMELLRVIVDRLCGYRTHLAEFMANNDQCSISERLFIYNQIAHLHLKNYENRQLSDIDTEIITRLMSKVEI